MHYRLLFIAIWPLLLLSCSSDTEVHKVMDENGNLLEEYTRDVKDYSKEGLYKKFYPSGALMETAFYVNDTINGEYIRYFKNGDTVTVAQMINGQYEGYFREYYPGNKLMQSYQHVNGAINGEFKDYHESGALKGVCSFKDNKEEGPFVEYYENGNKSFEGTYKQGKESGQLMEYEESGELIRKMNCELLTVNNVTSSVCETLWQKEGVE